MSAHGGSRGLLATEGAGEMTAELPEVRRIGGYIGAEICGLDLARDYPDETYAAIRRAWAEHGVIFFRDQFLTDEQRESSRCDSARSGPSSSCARSLIRRATWGRAAARLGRVLGQPPGVAHGRQRLPRDAPGDEPDPAGRVSASAGRVGGTVAVRCCAGRLAVSHQRPRPNRRTSRRRGRRPRGAAG
jgi:Taurine catabolism dioxygenase TauD, TfdA family